MATQTLAHKEHHALHAHQFDDVDQQREAVSLGMWAFLATEVLFFGALFAAYFVYRWKYPEAYHAASGQLDTVWGTLNTFVLLFSSFTMVLAVHASQQGKTNRVITYVIVTTICAMGFLVVKYFEYSAKWHHHLFPGQANFAMPPEGPIFPGLPAETLPHVKLFFVLYFAMTGLHAFHILIGIGALITLVVLAKRGWFTKDYNAPVDMVGLYWHFVDVVWVFLFPLLYLIDRSTSGGGH